MNKKNFKLFRFLTVLMSLAMLLNSTSMTVLAAGPGAFFDDSEVIIAYTEEDGEDFEETNDIDEYIEEDTEEGESDANNGEFKDPSEFIDGNTDHSQYLTYELDTNGNAIITGNTITQNIDLIIPSKIDGYDVVKIGYEAFKECDNLKSVTIPDSVTSIGDYAFFNCSRLISVTIPDSVTSIGVNAFSRCSSLTSVTIPDSVTSIGVYAFSRCSSLTSVTIPDSVTSIGEGAFAYCSSLTSVTIPDSVTSIGDGAFAYCSSLTSVTIPNSVTSIGNYAFYFCSNLISVTIPDSVTSIGDWAFESCSSLTSVTIPDSVSYLGKGAFYGCSSLTSVTIPDSLTSIGNDTFYSCHNLTSVTIPDSVTRIGDWTFYECRSLTSVTIPDSLTSIGEGAFYECRSLTSVTIPDSVTSIGKYAFYSCNGLTSVTISNGVKEIKENTFSICPKLSDVIIFPGTTNISDNAFDNPSTLIIHGIAGSYAEEWAESVGAQFVPLVIHATEISLNKEEMSLKVDESEKLILTVQPTVITDEIIWESNNNSVASVSDDGTVTAHEPGTATIRVTVGELRKTCEVTVTRPVTGITLNKTSLNLTVNKSETLTATVKPGNASNKTLKWTSSNTKVAKVDNAGKVTAVGAGTATITVTAADGSGKKATCKVTVTQPVTGITLNKTNIKLLVNKSETLTATVKPDNASNKNVKWSSSDSKVAKVDNAGKVTAVGEGTATITVTAADGSGVKATCKVTVTTQPVTGITLNKTSLNLTVNKSETLTATVKPDNASNKAVKWTSSNTKIATVDANGLVKAVGTGSATITATAADGSGVKATCKVTVTTQPVTGITLNKTSLNLTVNKSETLTATVKPDNASNKNVKWSSSDNKVAKVDTAGKVTAVGAGSATITAEAADGSGKKATCKVTVKQPVTGITLNKTSLNLTVNKTETLTATVKPDNASNKNVKWSSSDNKVAKVDNAGKVTAVGAGSATITVTAADGSGKKATCKVTVVKLVSKISLNKTNLLIHVGESETLKATASPSDASDKTVKWTTSDAKVVKVDSTGKITAVGEGTATITATAVDGSGKKATATVKVTKLVTDVFDDVKPADWFVKAVQYVYDNGIMAGTNGGKSFSPNGKLTREQFTQVLYAYEGKPEVTNMSGFSDVDANAWYAKSVYWAKEKGITGGKPDGTFGVNENISRQDLAVMLYTYAKIKNYDLTKNDNALDNFDDKGKVSNYAKDAMKWAVTQGVISGKGNGKVDPVGNATRAECATMIMKLIEKNK